MDGRCGTSLWGRGGGRFLRLQRSSSSVRNGVRTSSPPRFHERSKRGRGKVGGMVGMFVSTAGYSVDAVKVVKSVRASIRSSTVVRTTACRRRVNEVRRRLPSATAPRRQGRRSRTSLLCPDENRSQAQSASCRRPRTWNGHRALQRRWLEHRGRGRSGRAGRQILATSLDGRSVNNVGVRAAG
jgi:hypothetical protein